MQITIEYHIESISFVLKLEYDSFSLCRPAPEQVPNQFQNRKSAMIQDVNEQIFPLNYPTWHFDKGQCKRTFCMSKVVINKPLHYKK